MHNSLIFNNKVEFLSAISSSGSLCGIDHGMKKLGLAWTDDARRIALPGEVLQITGLQSAASKIGTLCAEKKPAGFVLGFPLQMDGTEGEACKRVMLFAERVLFPFELPILLVDERLTSQEAESLLSESTTSRKKAQEVDDAVAAYLLLESVIG